jgi:8-oxo-dGTP pyrophosphatase MutT (NUDIX family)
MRPAVPPTDTGPDIETRLRRALTLPGNDSSDFDLNPGVPLPEGRTLRPAGVLIAIDLTTPRPSVILTKRSPQLKHHPGQIAFPGGKQDKGDADPTAAALREAQEEVALPPASVDILGQLPPHETVTNFRVTPVLGLIRSPVTLTPEAGEVEEVFRVPFDFVTDPANFRVEGRRWQGRRRYYYAVPYGPYYIWGATGRILRALADRLHR